MSAYGTAKAGSDFGVQLQFPEVAAAAVASGVIPQHHAYAPRLHIGSEPPPVGEDLQDDYHAQKYADAVRMANAQVHSTQKSRWLLNHNSYGITQPRPVLGQRKFANPSNGNQADIYPARRDGGHAPFQCVSSARGGGYESEMNRGENHLTGGVLRTAEGQRYGHQLLMSRVKQLDVMDDSEEAFHADAALPPPEGLEKAEKAETADKIDLMVRLNQIDQVMNDTDAGVLAKALVGGLFKTIGDALTKVVQLGPSFEKGDLDDVKNVIDRIYTAFEGLEADRIANNGENIRESKSGWGTAFRMVELMLEYINGMYKGVNKTPAERKDLSRALIKSLGITKTTSTPGRRRPNTGPVPGPLDEGFPEADLRKESKKSPKPNANKSPGLDVKDTISSMTLPQLRELAEERGLPMVGTKAELLSRLQEHLQGTGKNWIANAIKKPGSFTKAAKRHGESVPEFEADVLSHPQRFSKTTQKRANLAKTLSSLPKGKGGARFQPKEFNGRARFDVDQRVRYGDQAGAYYGEAIGQRVATEPVPIPVEPDGTYIYPNSGATRPVFPKINKPRPAKSAEMKPIKEAKLPMFQQSAAGIFSAARQKIPTAHLTEAPKEFAYGGKKLTRAGLPKTLDGYKALAEELKSHGHTIRVGSGKLTNIRLNFIKRLLL